MGPLGEGGALCNRRRMAVPVGPPRPSSISHPEAPATVTCSYIVADTDGFLAGAIWYTTRRRRCQAPALRRARGEGAMRRRHSAVGNTWGVGFDPRSVFPWDCRSPVSHSTCDFPFPPRRTRESGDRFGIPKPRESGSVIEADRRRSGPSCVLPKGVSQGHPTLR